MVVHVMTLSGLFRISRSALRSVVPVRDSRYAVLSTE